MATAITPGLLDIWSTTARVNMPTDALVGIATKEVGSLHQSVVQPGNRGSTASIFCKLRKKNAR